MTDVDPLALAGWRAQVGDLPSEDLPRLATEALERGLDSPSLSELAGQNPRDVRDSRDLFIRALEELNLPAPDPTTAIRLLVRSTAAQIVAGDISPQNGARWLWQASDRVEDEGDLRVFIGLSSYADDHPEDIRTIDDQIVAAATELLERPELRRWVKLMASVEGSPTTRHHGITQETVEVSPEDLPLSGQLIVGTLSSFALWKAGRASEDSTRKRRRILSSTEAMNYRGTFKLNWDQHITSNTCPNLDALLA
jgi:hypothetical protein